MWGGGEQFVYDVADEMNRRGHYHVILLDSKNIKMAERMKDVAPLLQENLRCKGILALASLLDFIKKHSIDTLFVHSGKDVLLAILLKSLVGVKLLFVKHNVIGAKHDVYHRWVREQVDAFLCVSHLVHEKQTQGLTEIEKKKFHVVYNGINPSRFHDCDDLEPNEVFTLGYAGRIVENKGIFNLIQAVYILKEKGHRVRLLVAGQEGTFAQELKQYVLAHGLGELIIFQGLVSDMGSFYQRLHLLVAPSLVPEAFGLAPCEAMYCGTPVLVSDSGAQRDIVDHDKNGFMITDVSAEGLAREIEKILQYSREEMEEIQRQAKETIHQKFLIEYTVNRILECVK